MRKTIFKAVFILTSFTLVERVLGFLFKIYLSRQMGAVAMGIYSVALSFFLVLITLTNSGIPLVVSKLTAKLKKDQYKEVSSLTSAALLIELSLALIICGAVFLARKGFAHLFAKPESMTLVLIMLPGVLFSGVYSAFRGPVWGRQKFVSVSVIELVEQIARIVSCALLFTFVGNKLRMSALAMTIGCFTAALAAMVCYFIIKGRFANPKPYLKPLFGTAVPIIFTRTASSVNNYIIAVLVPFLLMTAGHTSEQAMYVFGVSVGMAMPLLFLPVTVVGSMAFVLIPTLSQAYAENDKGSLKRQTETAIKFTIVLSALFVPFYYSLGEPVGVFVYGNADAGKFLSLSSFLLVPIAFENIVSSMMNSVDLERKGFINYIIGSLVLFAVLLCAWGRFTIEIYAYAIGASLILSSILDVIDLKRKTGLGLEFIKTVILSVAIAVPSVFLSRWLYGILPLSDFFKIAVSGIASIVFGLLCSLVFDLIDLDIFFSAKRKKDKKQRIKPVKAKF